MTKKKRKSLFAMRQCPERSAALRAALRPEKRCLSRSHEPLLGRPSSRMRRKVEEEMSDSVYYVLLSIDASDSS